MHKIKKSSPANNQRGDGVAGAQRVLRVDFMFPVVATSAWAPHRMDTKGTISLGAAKFCYIVRSGLRSMSALMGVSAVILRDMRRQECNILHAVLTRAKSSDY